MRIHTGCFHVHYVLQSSKYSTWYLFHSHFTDQEIEEQWVNHSPKLIYIFICLLILPTDTLQWSCVRLWRARMGKMLALLSRSSQSNGNKGGKEQQRLQYNGFSPGLTEASLGLVAPRPWPFLSPPGTGPGSLLCLSGTLFQESGSRGACVLGSPVVLTWLHPLIKPTSCQRSLVLYTPGSPPQDQRVVISSIKCFHLCLQAREAIFALTLAPQKCLAHGDIQGLLVNQTALCQESQFWAFPPLLRVTEEEQELVAFAFSPPPTKSHTSAFLFS